MPGVSSCNLVRPRSRPWHPPSSVFRLPTGYHSSRPLPTSGTDTKSLNHKSLISLSFHESDTCPSRDPSHQEAAGGALHPGQGTLQAPLEVPGEPAASSPPGEGPRHHPAAGDDRETPGFLRLSHDLQEVRKREILQPVAQPVGPGTHPFKTPEPCSGGPRSRPAHHPDPARRPGAHAPRSGCLPRPPRCAVSVP